RRHELRRTCLLKCVLQTLLQLLRAGALERQAHADAAAQGEQLLGAEALDEPAVAGQHHGQEDVAVDARGGQKAHSSAKTFGTISWASSTISTGRTRAASMWFCQRSLSTLQPAQRLWGVSCTPNSDPSSRKKSWIDACGRESTPTVTSRCAASRSARMRSVTDLPVPGAPVINANPPSPASCSTRQQKD